MCKKIFCVIMVMTVMVCFIGCKHELKTEVKISDLVTTAFQNEATFAKTEVIFSIPSKNEFEMKKSYFKKVALGCFGDDIEDFRFEQEGPNSFVKFNTLLPIMYNTYSSNYLFNIVYTNKDTLLYLNHEKFNKLKNEIKDKFMFNFDIQDIDFKVVIINDIGKNAKFSCYANYINGRPYTYMTKHDVLASEWDKMTIRLSDMSKDMMLRKGKAAYLFEN